MKNLSELTLEEIKTKHHQLQSKWRWHKRREWCREDSEKRCKEISKEIKELVTFLQNKVEVVRFLRKHKVIK